MKKLLCFFYISIFLLQANAQDEQKGNIAEINGIEMYYEVCG